MKSIHAYMLWPLAILPWLLPSHGFAEYDTIKTQCHHSPNTHINTLVLPGAYFPESISADRHGTLYISSITGGEILKFSPPYHHPGEIFLPAGVNINSTGVLVDAKRDVLWSCNVDLSLQMPSALRAFDLGTGNLIAGYPIPDLGLCADMTLADNGTLYITDTLLSRILRLTTVNPNRATAGKLSVWADDPILTGTQPAFLKINGIATDTRNRFIYTTHYSSGVLYRIAVRHNGEAGTIDIINTNVPLSTPDGLRMLDKHTLLVAQNSSGVARIRLHGTQGRVQQLTAQFDQPSSLVLTDRKTLWVTEGQILRLVGADPSPINFPFKVKKLRLD